jgi:hypothetical protein
MNGLRRGSLVLAVMAAVLAASALPSGAAMQGSMPSVVMAKTKPKTTKPKKVLSACKLLTIAEITQALGTAPTEPPKSDSKDECDYSSPAEYNFINLGVRPLVNAKLWKLSANGINVNIPVAGIGDEALRSATNGTIMVRKGTQTLRIDQYVQGLSDTALESLGKAAAARL